MSFGKKEGKKKNPHKKKNQTNQNQTDERIQFHVIKYSDFCIFIWLSFPVWDETHDSSWKIEDLGFVLDS